jgi:hypothetical protein
MSRHDSIGRRGSDRSPLGVISRLLLLDKPCQPEAQPGSEWYRNGAGGWDRSAPVEAIPGQAAAGAITASVHSEAVMAIRLPRLL